jgi:hypothetical protein
LLSGCGRIDDEGKENEDSNDEEKDGIDNSTTSKAAIQTTPIEANAIGFGTPLPTVNILPDVIAF